MIYFYFFVFIIVYISNLFWDSFFLGILASLGFAIVFEIPFKKLLEQFFRESLSKFVQHIQKFMCESLLKFPLKFHRQIHFFFDIYLAILIIILSMIFCWKCSRPLSMEIPSASLLRISQEVFGNFVVFFSLTVGNYSLTFRNYYSIVKVFGNKFV